MTAPDQLVITLLGAPQVERNGELVTAPRGRKCWALLAYLLLRERPVPRLALAELLFPDADDPLRALRWTLVELRRALGGSEVLHGDPLQLALPPGTQVDVLALTGEGASISLGQGALLEGSDFRATPAFDSRLRVERRMLAGIYEQLIHNEALSRLAEGETGEAARLAALCVTRDPLDENHQELLVRCLAANGDERGALRQAEGCVKLFREQLGREPGPALREAARVGVALTPPAGGDAAAAQAQLDAGHAAIAAGAVEPGIDCLRLSCAEAEASGDTPLHAALPRRAGRRARPFGSGPRRRGRGRAAGGSHGCRRRAGARNRRVRLPRARVRRVPGWTRELGGTLARSRDRTGVHRRGAVQRACREGADAVRPSALRSRAQACRREHAARASVRRPA